MKLFWVILTPMLAVLLVGSCGCSHESESSVTTTGKSQSAPGSKGTPEQMNRFNGAQTPEQVPLKYRELARQANEKARAHQVPVVKP